MTRFNSLLIVATSAIFVLYGIACLLAPELMSTTVTGSAPTSPSGMIDLRATYGGMSIGVGGLLFLLAAPPYHDRGLLGVLLLMTGMATGRLYGIVMDGPANRFMYAYLALEVLVALIAFGAWRQHNTGRGHGPEQPD